MGTVGLEQALDWSDKRGANINIASAELQVARAEYIVRRQQLTGELLSGLADYHTAEAAQALAQERARLMTDFSDLSQKRRRAGDLSQIELDLASLARTQADLELSLAATDLAQAGQNLAAVTGQAVQDWPELPADIPAPVDFDAQALLTALPQIRALQARSAAARARVELRRRERRPDPTLGATVGQERTFRNGEDDSFGVVGLNLSVPLFVRNSFAAEVDTANAELAEAEQTKHEAFRRAQARLLSAAERYRLSHAAWQAWQRSGRPSLSSQVSQLDRIWKYGEMSTADYLVQLNQTLETRAAALKIQNRLWDAWADWLVASGEVDDWLTRKP
ncbi:outer membrane protein [Salinisphaera sp. PC39]